MAISSILIRQSSVIREKDTSEGHRPEIPKRNQSRDVVHIRALKIGLILHKSSKSIKSGVWSFNMITAERDRSMAPL